MTRGVRWFILLAWVAMPLLGWPETDAERMVSTLLGGTNISPAAVPAVAPTAPEPAEEEEPEMAVDTAVTKPDTRTEPLPTTTPDEAAEVSVFPAGGEVSPEMFQQQPFPTDLVLQVEHEPAPARPETRDEPRFPFVSPGTLAGKITDHRGRPVRGARVVLFNDTTYKSMLSTPGGNFGFNIFATNEYTLTVTYENQFFYTNLFLAPPAATLLKIAFVVPITVYGQLIIDKKPAQYGLFLRLNNAEGGRAGAVVLSNGLFRIPNLTPARYTLILERRKRFIDRRLHESRFYVVPVTLTTETVRIVINRDRRNLTGNILIDNLPRRYVDAIVILRDARTGGRLIHREAYTYYTEGSFLFPHVQPGIYLIEAVQSQGEWQSSRKTIVVRPQDKNPHVNINVRTDPQADTKRIEQLKRQFSP
ncbi:MAG: carboxypeptidase-like regulatory domain-containing protein [bacterium]|nr:carboxypeptidase-like regulatory domain-containing protein [bacterium]